MCKMEKLTWLCRAGCAGCAGRAAVRVVGRLLHARPRVRVALDGDGLPANQSTEGNATVLHT